MPLVMTQHLDLMLTSLVSTVFEWLTCRMSNQVISWK